MLARGALSTPLLLSMSEPFSVPFYTLIKYKKTLLHKSSCLSDQAWSLVPKLNLLQRSRSLWSSSSSHLQRSNIVHCNLSILERTLLSVRLIRGLIKPGEPFFMYHEESTTCYLRQVGQVILHLWVLVAYSLEDIKIMLIW